MRFLVDTHIVLWAALDDPRLRGAARDIFVDAERTPIISVASLWEMSIEYSLGKLPLPVPPSDFFAREVATRGYEVLRIERQHAERTASLPWLASGHRGPFDRLLVAQALVEGVPILSGDRRFAEYGDHGLALLG